VRRNLIDIDTRVMNHMKRDLKALPQIESPSLVTEWRTSPHINNFSIRVNMRAIR